LANIHVYKGTVTTGGTNGTLVSEAGAQTSPIIIGPLNATNNEVSTDQKLAIRCDTGYVTTGDTVITPTGTTSAKWALAPDNAGSAGTYGAYGAALTLSSAIDATNTIFWAKAKATSDESPVNDTAVALQTTATVAAV